MKSLLSCMFALAVAVQPAQAIPDFPETASTGSLIGEFFSRRITTDFRIYDGFCAFSSWQRGSIYDAGMDKPDDACWVRQNDPEHGQMIVMCRLDEKNRITASCERIPWTLFQGEKARKIRREEGQTTPEDDAEEDRVKLAHIQQLWDDLEASNRTGKLVSKGLVYGRSRSQDGAVYLVGMPCPGGEQHYGIYQNHSDGVFRPMCWFENRAGVLDICMLKLAPDSAEPSRNCVAWPKSDFTNLIVGGPMR